MTSRRPVPISGARPSAISNSAKGDSTQSNDAAGSETSALRIQEPEQSAPPQSHAEDEAQPAQPAKPIHPIEPQRPQAAHERVAQPIVPAKVAPSQSESLEPAHSKQPAPAPVPTPTPQPPSQEEEPPHPPPPAPIKPGVPSSSEQRAHPEPRRRARTPSGGGRRRPAASISDDEAEYNAQVSQDSGDSGLPPLKVDVGTTRMESIAVNNWRSGRASSRTFNLERVRARQLKKRRTDDEASSRASSVGPVKESGTPVPDAHEQEEEFGENRFAVQTRIVDGKIVLDEQSLFANYRDDELQDREQRHWEVIDEREGDQFINSASRGKQRRTQRWSAEETERFFQAVSQWGTDFEMITRLFPKRTRREIKSKWTKESRQNPRQLDDAFRRRVKVDLTAYGNAVGVDLSGPPPVITPKMPDIEIKESQQPDPAVEQSNTDPSVVEEVGTAM